MTADVLVVGGGISGLACARRCDEAGLLVQVLDRGRRLGGRLAARTRHDHPIDLGAPYCTATDERFRAVVNGWVGRGLLRPWTDTFRTAGPGGLGGHRQGPMRYAAPRGMRSLVDDLAVGIDAVERDVRTVGPGRLVDGGLEAAHAVVLAMPGPQAVRLLQAEHLELVATAQQSYSPGITVVAPVAERTWPDFDGAFVSGLPIRWLADDGASRGDGAPVLVAHTTPELAAAHLDDPAAAIAPALDAMRQVLGVGLDAPDAFAHRWTYAQPSEPRDATFALSPTGIGLCGDGWSARSKVEAAWLSGDDLGAAIVERLR
ncbi:NAD(P)/FAD-dependent oxidoreductase [uncultured Amnibacterium sp.]|uniref:NAD(P)/FAD-dependent oxidoreductase n=1 Tax=uncultured Amnibacterium sp. TaxID=1631851 RepID=UPI0035CAF38B